MRTIAIHRRSSPGRRRLDLNIGEEGVSQQGCLVDVGFRPTLHEMSFTKTPIEHQVFHEEHGRDHARTVVYIPCKY